MISFESRFNMHRYHVKHRKIGLDYVRATAILLVLTAHAFHGRTSKLDVCGFIGVELFFVLSGYLIGGILLSSIARNGNTISFGIVREFWVRRWLRTLPNYFLFLPVYMVINHFGPQKQMLLYLTFTQNLVTPLPTLFYSLSWSLAVEEWFYTLLPLLALGLFMVFRRINVAFLGTFSGLFVVPLLLRLIFGQHHPWDSWMRKIVVFRLDSLMWGVGLAALHRYRTASFIKLCHPVLAGFGVVGLVAISTWITISRRMYSTATAMDALTFDAVSIACAMVIPYCSMLVSTGNILNRAAYLVSVISYSLYLGHIAAFHVVGLAGSYIHSRMCVGFLQACAAFGLAAGVYYGFERPILRWRDRVTQGARTSEALASVVAA